MKRIILCSSNPLLVKSLYGVLRDQGYVIEEVEHPAHAVRKVLGGRYDLVIIDAEPFGLSADDAADIIRAVAPELPVFSVGAGARRDAVPLLRLPAELDAVTQMLQRIPA